MNEDKDGDATSAVGLERWVMGEVLKGGLTCGDAKQTAKGMSPKRGGIYLRDVGTCNFSVKNLLPSQPGS